MANEKDEWISALVDGELDPDDRDRMLKTLPRDDGLRERWQRYHLIRDALHHNLEHQPAADFALNVHAALEQEPAILAPKSVSGRLPHNWLKHSVGVAVAASVAAVAILTVQTVNTDETEVVTVAEVQPPTIQREMIRVAQPAIQPGLQALPTVQNRQLTNRQLESYRVKHNTFSSVTHTHDVMPYARIVSHNE